MLTGFPMNKGTFFSDRKSFKAQTSFQMKNFSKAAEYQDTKCEAYLFITATFPQTIYIVRCPHWKMKRGSMLNHE